MGAKSLLSGVTITPSGASDWCDEVSEQADGQEPAIIVASDDMPTEVKKKAQYVCDGTADQVQIDDAIEDAAALSSRNAGEDGVQRAKVQLTGGRFNLSDHITMRTGVWLAGMGKLTEIRAVSLTSTGMIELANTSVHMTVLSDLWLNGNWASGGTTSSGVYYLSATSGDDHTTYPNSGNDPSNLIERLMIQGLGNNANRHGIHLDTDLRLSTIKDVYMRDIGGTGVWMDGSPDSHIENVHIGPSDGRGFYIQGANNRLVNCKAFYCDSWAYEFTSGYAQVVACEAQDSLNGMKVAGTHFNGSAITIDTCDVTGLEIAASGAVINGVQVACRSGGRYGNTNTGIVFTSTPTNLILTGRVDTTNVTTRYSGTTGGSGNFIRITGNNSLLSVG